ncbi:hypothetical protein ACFW2D_11300 [Streptomyces sp. NPDC058914]|uniref:hypothetical protein n=1 Tax=Streptomyces TaxID=1883 RepID=UPI0036B2D8E2
MVDIGVDVGPDPPAQFGAWSGCGVPAVDGAFDPTVFDVAERTAFPNGVTLTRLTRR